MQENEQGDDVEQRTCQICKALFVNYGSMREHLLIQHAIKEIQFACFICGENCKTRNSAFCHMEMHHLHLRFFLRTKRFQAALISVFNAIELYNRNLGSCIQEGRDGVGIQLSHLRCFHDAIMPKPTNAELAALTQSVGKARSFDTLKHNMDMWAKVKGSNHMKGHVRNCQRRARRLSQLKNEDEIFKKIIKRSALPQDLKIIRVVGPPLETTPSSRALVKGALGNPEPFTRIPPSFDPTTSNVSPLAPPLTLVGRTLGRPKASHKSIKAGRPKASHESIKAGQCSENAKMCLRDRALCNPVKRYAFDDDLTPAEIRKKAEFTTVPIVKFVKPSVEKRQPTFGKRDDLADIDNINIDSIGIDKIKIEPIDCDVYRTN